MTSCTIETALADNVGARETPSTAPDAAASRARQVAGDGSREANLSRWRRPNNAVRGSANLAVEAEHPISSPHDHCLTGGFLRLRAE
jgi:hypothetical protein